ncbi:MAG: hypothetical protein ACRECQ_14225 [Burkholderiaceae bacterium]
MRTLLTTLSAIASLFALANCSTAQSQAGGNTTFFITSAGPGKGADLGGIEGADKHCQSLAQAAGLGNRTWRAYLSTQGTAINDPKVTHARDRIGTGPWHNAKGVQIASNVEELHGKNNLNKDTALSEKGQPVNDRTMKPNTHDILTGSRPDGTAFPINAGDLTCGNWTKSGTDGAAYVGHHDRAGPTDHSWATSWNSSHPSSGCSQEGLVKTGGAGLFYCFATK